MTKGEGENSGRRECVEMLLLERIFWPDSVSDYLIGGDGHDVGDGEGGEDGKEQ